ncbi:hypothetical protein SAMN05421664_1793 [Chryseobacterium soldanellicola]|uniref:Uncharacterized protein n=1 Tax=Chryseobacterium soldanellicola TaxID=311333 RepID=A0A1H1BAY7_9FLAO|nr:hypothetical protein SAMN05421664_1793 [Chryseobacterium soldanellicola]
MKIGLRQIDFQFNNDEMNIVFLLPQISRIYKDDCGYL